MPLSAVNYWGSSKRKQKNDLIKTNYEKGIPTYKVVIRSQSPLLQACWNQDWIAAMQRLERKAQEAFHINQSSGRTALHLATIPGVASPSLELIVKLIEINPHAVLVPDRYENGSTPIHFICGNKAIRENPALIRFFIETALKEYARIKDSVRMHSWSPLYWASTRSAPAETLDILIQTKPFIPWIAPWTGAETIEESHSIHCDRSDSPLVALWSKTGRDIPDLNGIDDRVVFEMREIVQSILGRPLDGMTLICSTNRSSLLEAWVRIVTLFRNPSLDIKPHTLLRRVSTLYVPLPDLVSLMCRLFPEQLLQVASVSMSCPEIPLHAVLRHQWFGEGNADSIPEIIRILVTAQPESLMCIHGSTRLYTVFLAASDNNMISLEIIFNMMRLSPHALQLQRNVLKFSQAHIPE